MKGGHSRAHTSRISKIDLAAGCPSESHTAAVKRAQSHSVSSLFTTAGVFGDCDGVGLA